MVHNIVYNFYIKFALNVWDGPDTHNKTSWLHLTYLYVWTWVSQNIVVRTNFPDLEGTK